MDTHAYCTIRLSHWQDYKSYVEQFSGNWAFRGQANSNWVLNNAIERTDFIHYYKGIEVDFLSEFQRGARNYLTRDDTPGHLIEWLALMQHHGAPTRLLDLTRSPFIAAYFAYEICSGLEGDFVGIWGVNIQFLKDKALEILKEEFSEALIQSKNLINETLFEKIFYSNNKKLVFPVEPFRMNKRYSLQQSVFIATGISAVPLMDQLQFMGSDISKAVVKLEVPSCHKKEVLRDLLQMNLHRASLFPDLDGYAASLRYRYNSLRSPQEVQEQLNRSLQDKHFPFIP